MVQNNLLEFEKNTYFIGHRHQIRVIAHICNIGMRMNPASNGGGGGGGVKNFITNKKLNSINNECEIEIRHPESTGGGGGGGEG